MPENDFEQELTEGEKEGLRFEREKRAGYYQPPPDAAASRDAMRRGGLAIGAVYALVGSIVSLTIAGYFLDRFFNAAPWFVTSGVILGTIVGFYQFIRINSRNN